VHSPVYIETQYAIYLLNSPSRLYKPHFHHFYTPHRIAQLVVTSALDHPRQSYDEFLRGILAHDDYLLNDRIFEDDLDDAVCS
jgi:DNA (cytosine-5)-methyltransferase 1